MSCNRQANENGDLEQFYTIIQVNIITRQQDLQITVMCNKSLTNISGLVTCINKSKLAFLKNYKVFCNCSLEFSDKYHVLFDSTSSKFLDGIDTAPCTGDKEF